jgi:hypothetical protein
MRTKRCSYLHNPPVKIENPPEYTVIQSSVNSGYYDLQAVCHTCDQWTGGNAVDFSSESLYWIQAAYAGDFKSSSNAERMNRRKHPYAGMLFISLTDIWDLAAYVLTFDRGILRQHAKYPYRPRQDPRDC